MFGDDTEVRTWERLYDDQKRDRLKYDVLLAPHHCSWHSLSWGSAEDKNAKVSVKAKGSLSNANAGAYIILSCKSNDDEGEKAKRWDVPGRGRYTRALSARRRLFAQGNMRWMVSWHLLCLN